MRKKICDQAPIAQTDYRVGCWDGVEPAVLAVHGITSSHVVWQRLVRVLSCDNAIYAPDLRGRGDNYALPPPYGFDTHISDLQNVLDHFALDSVIYIGHSLGAYIGLELAHAAPARLRGMVLIDGGISLPLPADADPEQVIAGILGPALTRLKNVYSSREEYLAFWRAHPAFADRDAFNDDVIAMIDYELGGIPPQLKPRVNPDAVYADSYGPLAPSMVTRIAEVQVPTLLLTAPRGLLNQPDPLLPKSAVAEKCASNPLVRHQEIADTNHYSIVTGAGAEPVAKEIDRFISELEPI